MQDKYLIIETESNLVVEELSHIENVQIVTVQSFDSSVIQQIIIPVTAIVAAPLFALIQQAVKGHTVKARFNNIEVEGDYNEVVKLLELIRKVEKDDTES